MKQYKQENLNVYHISKNIIGNFRIQYVFLYLENKYNFDKAPSGLVTTFNVPYDYQSVMHYPRAVSYTHLDVYKRQLL